MHMPIHCCTYVTLFQHEVKKKITTHTRLAHSRALLCIGTHGITPMNYSTQIQFVRGGSTVIIVVFTIFVLLLLFLAVRHRLN